MHSFIKCLLFTCWQNAGWSQIFPPMSKALFYYIFFNYFWSIYVIHNPCPLLYNIQFTINLSKLVRCKWSIFFKILNKVCLIVISKSFIYLICEIILKIIYRFLDSYDSSVLLHGYSKWFLKYTVKVALVISCLYSYIWYCHAPFFIEYDTCYLDDYIFSFFKVISIYDMRSKYISILNETFNKWL